MGALNRMMIRSHLSCAANGSDKTAIVALASFESLKIKWCASCRSQRAFQARSMPFKHTGNKARVEVLILIRWPTIRWTEVGQSEFIPWQGLHFPWTNQNLNLKSIVRFRPVQSFMKCWETFCFPERIQYEKACKNHPLHRHVLLSAGGNGRCGEC